MKYNVSWSPLSKETYLKTLKDVLEKWNKKEAMNVKTLIDEKVSALENNKYLCPPSKKQDLRKCVISKQTSLIYEVVNNKIELLLFIDNRENIKY